MAQTRRASIRPSRRLPLCVCVGGGAVQEPAGWPRPGGLVYGPPAACRCVCVRGGAVQEPAGWPIDQAG